MDAGEDRLGQRTSERTFDDEPHAGQRSFSFMD
jgi:hypothetical protein